MPAPALRTGVLLAAVLGLSSCAEDEPEAMPATEEEYLGAVVDIEGAAIGEDDELTRCVWATIINAVGFERIVAVDVTPSELIGSTLADNDLDVKDDVAAELAADVDGCGDLVSALLVDVDEDVADCFSARVSNELAAEAVIEGFRGNDPPEEFVTAAEECAPD